MLTQKPFVTIDAPPPGSRRATAALALALQLREELLDGDHPEPLVDRTPFYRLIHHTGLQEHPAREAKPESGTSTSSATERKAPSRYIAIGPQDVKRLHRIAHMLSALTSELTLWLASLPQATEDRP